MSLGRDLPGSASQRNKRISGHAKGGGEPQEGGFPVRAEQMWKSVEAGVSTDPLKRTPGTRCQEELN